jgi:hypothetical protein
MAHVRFYPLEDNMVKRKEHGLWYQEEVGSNPKSSLSWTHSI